MSQNINRHRSPIQKPAATGIIRGGNYNFGFYPTNRPQKNDMHSSTEESTPSHEQSSILKETNQGPSSSNLAFYKIKKQEPYLTKPENNINTMYLKSNSQKIINYKIQMKNQHRNGNSPEKCYDYFGYKTTQKNFKEKINLQSKLSDSGDSSVSHHSNNSHNIQNDKPTKFLQKKLEKKFSEQNLLKLGSNINDDQSRQQNLKKHVPLFLQERLQLQKKTKNQNNLPPQSPRRQSPKNHNPHSPSKKEQSSSSYFTQNGIYKRSSLTPQNKLQMTKQVNYDQTKQLTPKKVSPLKLAERQRQYTPPKLIFQEDKFTKPNNFYPTQFKDNKSKITSTQSPNFSFSKQHSQKNPEFSQQSQASQQQNYSSKLSPRNFVSLPIITISPVAILPSSSFIPFSSHPSYPFPSHPPTPISFFIIQKLAKNRSCQIYKCLHPPTCMVFCLKKCVVDRYNIEQLIVEHKVSISLSHPNVVRAFGSFYDRGSLYLLMEYMDGRSLLNRAPFYLKKPDQMFEQPEQKFFPTKNPSSSLSPDLKLNRLSFRQRPKFRQTMYDHQSKQPQLQQARFSNLHPLSSPFPLQPPSPPLSTLPQPQKLPMIKDLLEQLLHGLVYLHQNNITHRDLKPDNIFTSHLCYKIGDFGSCSYTNSQQYIGTLDYAAPQIMLRKPYNSSIDIWSIGCIAYQLDVGKAPFYHRQREQTVRRIVGGEYDRGAISTESLRKFIAGCLVVDGNKRITAEKALLEIRDMDIGRQWEKEQEAARDREKEKGFASGGGSNSQHSLTGRQRIFGK